MARDTDRYDLFVSYARANNQTGWITQFLAALKAELPNLTAFFDAEEIRHGDDWQIKLRHAVAQSRIFLAFLSPEYLQSEWCRKEWRAWLDAEIAKHIFSDGARPIYIVEVPGNPADQILQQLQRRQYCDVRPFFNEGLDALKREDLRRILADLAKGLDEQSQRVRHAAQSDNTVPAYNRFSGRTDELLDLRERLKHHRSGVVCGIHGLGGIGKTELAYACAQAVMRARKSAKSARMRGRLRGGSGGFRRGYRSGLRGRRGRMAPSSSSSTKVTTHQLMSEQETDELTTLGPALHLLITTRLEPPPLADWLTLGVP
jgi:hypothetical protein